MKNRSRVLWSLLALALLFPSARAQTDTEFWFVAPEVSKNADFDIPITLRFTTLGADSTVTVEQPANGAFPVQNLIIPANSVASLDLTAFLSSIENLPVDSVNNWGLHITATAPVSAYYEVVSGFCNCNPEIFALKGMNALGLDFYTPFQTFLNNSGGYNPTPFASFEIVATEDDTNVTILPTRDLVGHLAGVPYGITLQQGQTYSGRAASQLASEHPIGTRITSDKPIAVTMADDLLSGAPYGGCADLMGDQLIPVNRLSNQYILVRGALNGGVEKAFVVATEDGTSISVDGVPAATINAGESYVVTFGTPNVFVEADKNIYVMHMSGFGCEVGGAVLPGLECAGSSQVGVARSTGEGFFLNLLVETGAEGDFLFNGAAGIINAADFVTVPNTGGQWQCAKKTIPVGDLPAGGSAVVSNTSDTFQMGIIHGGAGSGTRFGYFSDFATINVTASNASPFCPGNAIQLFASAIPGASYSWTGPNGFTSDLQNPVIDTAPASAAGAYTVVADDGSCTGSSTTVVALDADEVCNPSGVPTTKTWGLILLGLGLLLAVPVVLASKPAVR